MAEYGYPKNSGLKILIFVVVSTSLAISKSNILRTKFSATELILINKLNFFLVEHGTMVVLVSKRAERLAAYKKISFGEAFFYCMFREVFTSHHLQKKIHEIIKII